VRVDGRPVKLAKKEFELLHTLAGDPLRVFSKEELLRDVWGFRARGNTRTLDSHASRLRRKLDPEGRRFVVNVWGYGYRLLHGPESSAPAGELSVNGAGW
jgi:DNA-binding response OmpR family regulator